MVYVLLVDGFEEIEAITPIDIMRRCGIEVSTVGLYKREVTGSHGLTVTADILPNEVKREEMSLLMLPGGPGFEGIERSPFATELISYAAERNIFIAAICAAPSIIGKMGLLDGKNAVCFPGYEECLKGAVLSDEKAVKDGFFITAKGAGAASEFGFMIAKALIGSEKPEEIRKSMQY